MKNRCTKTLNFALAKSLLCQYLRAGKALGKHHHFGNELVVRNTHSHLSMQNTTHRRHIRALHHSQSACNHYFIILFHHHHFKISNDFTKTLASLVNVAIPVIPNYIVTACNGINWEYHGSEELLQVVWQLLSTSIAFGCRVQGDEDPGVVIHLNIALQQMDGAVTVLDRRLERKSGENSK